MRALILFSFLLATINVWSQKEELAQQAILFSYSYQIPIEDLNDDFGNNSAIGWDFIRNKQTLLLGFDGIERFSGVASAEINNFIKRNSSEGLLYDLQELSQLEMDWLQSSK